MKRESSSSSVRAVRKGKYFPLVLLVKDQGEEADNRHLIADRLGWFKVSLSTKRLSDVSG
jgi:hypothetical protein